MVLVKVEKIRKFQELQKENKPIVDSLYNRISKLTPGINAQYEEEDIKYLLNDLKNTYQNNGWDNRYKSVHARSRFLSNVADGQKGVVE